MQIRCFARNRGILTWSMSLLLTLLLGLTLFVIATLLPPPHVSWCISTHLPQSFAKDVEKKGNGKERNGPET